MLSHACVVSFRYWLIGWHCVVFAIVGKILILNVIKNMNNCSFVILVVHLNSSNDMITKVLEFLKD